MKYRPKIGDYLVSEKDTHGSGEVYFHSGFYECIEILDYKSASNEYVFKSTTTNCRQYLNECSLYRYPTIKVIPKESKLARLLYE